MQRSLVRSGPRALPCRLPRRTVVVRAAAEELQPWQEQKLQRAYVAGRRQVKVEKLCKELGLPRQTVLQWLRDQPPLDRAQASLLEARAAAEEAALERQAVLQQQRQQQQQASSSSKAAGGPGRSGPGGGGSGTAPWKQYAKKKHLGRQAEATLEMVFSRTQWPSDDTVSSMWDLHRLPREKVVEWFQQRRRQEQQQLRGGGGGGKRGGSSRGSSSGAEGEGVEGRGRSGGTDWDAEWDNMP